MSDDAQAPPELRPCIRVAADGPYFVSGEVALTARVAVHDEHGDPLAWAGGEIRSTRATYVLCRCGHSGNKPFCDGTHTKIGFDGTCTAGRSAGAMRHDYIPDGAGAPSEKSYPPTVAAIPDGPFWVLGGIPIEMPDGFRYEIRNRQLLCRCGGSQNKPFCDGSHRRITFEAPT
jgi:CDGSH-type Zn-finger protein